MSPNTSKKSNRQNINNQKIKFKNEAKSDLPMPIKKGKQNTSIPINLDNLNIPYKKTNTSPKKPTAPKQVTTKPLPNNPKTNSSLKNIPPKKESTTKSNNTSRISNNPKAPNITPIVKETTTPKEIPHKKKLKLKKSVIRNFTIFIIIIASGFLLYSTYNVYKWYQNNREIEKLTQELQNKVTITDIDETEKEIVIPEIEEPKENPYWDYIKMSLIDVDISELKTINKDTIGWIQVNGTNINYPFVQTNNNDYYLTHAFNKSVNEAGWIFLDYRNNINNLDKNTIIYGHGRLDKTMFGSLKNILTSNWYNNLDNHVIKDVLNNSSSLWQVFSVYRIPNTNDYLKTTFSNDDEFKEFVDMLKQRSAFNFNTEVLPSDKIITLSTCYDLKDKVVMHAKLIKYTN